MRDRYRTALRLVTFALAVVAGLVAVGCGSEGEASTEAREVVTTEGRPSMAPQRGGGPTRWAIAGPPRNDKYFHIFSVVEYCGGPKPEFGPSGISEGRAAVVLTEVVLPRGQGAGACAPLEITLEKTVRLHRALGDRALLDGSTSPPQRRWPPSK